MNKTCGDCRFYAKETEHCRLKGIGWKFATDTPCSGFSPREPITNGDKIIKQGNNGLAAFACGLLNDRSEETFLRVLSFLNAPAESEGDSMDNKEKVI